MGLAQLLGVSGGQGHTDTIAPMDGRMMLFQKIFDLLQHDWSCALVLSVKVL